VQAKHFVLPHHQYYISKQIKNVQLSGLCVDGLLRRGGSGWASLMIIQRQPSFLKLYPIEVLRSNTMLFHGNTIINRAKEFAEIAANTFNCGPYLLLFPLKGKSGAAVQYQTFYSTTSTALHIQTNKKCSAIWAVCWWPSPPRRIGMGS
jgi:hypothetical protein